MANKRIFQVQELVTNGQAVGGLAMVAFNAAYRDVIQSTPDAAFGAEDVDRGGLRVGLSLQCSDVAKVNAILAAAVGDTTFRGKESGAATWHKYTVPGIVYSGMNLTFPKNADGSLRLDGAVRFADNTKDLKDVLALTAADATAQSLTYPARLYRPSNASFDPDGADPAIAPLHVESVALTLAGNLLEDYADDDIGHTAVDLAGWGPLGITLVHRDASDPGEADPSDISAKIMAAARGVLTVDLLGRGGATGKTLTINNLLWSGVDSDHKADYTDFTLTGVAGWRATDDTKYDLTGGVGDPVSVKLFEIA